ncbi:MAG TPA: hypothetical protein HPP94_08845 [Desulfuromonadales bacterium]|nr:hypothetical protein [Desulfuromonadales bacterium]
MNTQWKTYLIPLVLFLTAFLVRYHFLATYNYPMMIHEQDAVGYMDVAREILQWHPLPVTGRPPGYPLSIALFALLPVDLEYAARLASIFMDALVTIPLFFMVRSVTSSRTASAAAPLLWAFFGFALAFSTSPLSQSTFLFYLLTAIVLIHRSLTGEKTLMPLFLGGMSIGAAYLSRPEGIVACLYLACVVVAVRLVQKKQFKPLLKELLLLGVGVMLLVGPFMAAYRHQTGQWALTNKSAAAVKTQDGILVLNAQGELPVSPEGLALWKEYYGSLSVFLHSSLSNASQFAEAYIQVLPRWLHLLSLLGLLVLLKERRFTEIVCFMTLLAVTVPNYIVNISKSNSYNYPVFTLAFLCAAIGCEALRRSLLSIIPVSRGPLIRLASALVIAAPVLYFSIAGYSDAEANYRSPQLIEQAQLSGQVFRGAGELIKKHSRPADLIMTRWGLIGYFADRPVVTLPKGEIKDVVGYGRKHGVRFLIIDTMSVFSRRQELQELLNPLYGKELRSDYGLKPVAVLSYDVGGCVIYEYSR